jgi:transposase
MYSDSLVTESNTEFEAKEEHIQTFGKYPEQPKIQNYIKQINDSKEFQTDSEYIDHYNSINANSNINDHLKKKRRRKKKKRRKRKQKKKDNADIKIELRTRNGTRHKYKIDP